LARPAAIDEFLNIGRIERHFPNGHKQSQIDELLPWNYPAFT
jgi:hypothetical protein